MPEVVHTLPGASFVFKPAFFAARLSPRRSTLR
jgi:hypothetical protein